MEESKAQGNTYKSDSNMGLYPESLVEVEQPSMIDHEVKHRGKSKKKFTTNRKKNFGKSLKFR